MLVRLKLVTTQKTMAKIAITDRRDYEMYVKNLVHKNLKLNDTMKKLVVALAMQSFDDGVSFVQLDLKVTLSQV